MITPTSGQTLPGFELVHGPSAAASLVRVLRPRWVLPMHNGAIDASGLVAPLVSEIGTQDDFERRLQAERVDATANVLEIHAGVPVTLSIER